MIKFSEPGADLFIPGGGSIANALSRTSHLAIAAHQDDIEILAFHGIAECYQQAERGFCGVVVTDGAGSPRAGDYAEYTDKKMQEVRAEEQRAAAKLGEYSAQFQLAYPSHQVKNTSALPLVDELEEILIKTQPEVVYLHNPMDKHDTHVAVFLKSLAALRRLPEKIRPKVVYACEVWRDLDWVCDKEKIALKSDEPRELALALLQVFDSQVSGGKRYDQAVLGRRLAHATFSHSHAVDDVKGVTYAIDVMPLLENPMLTVEDYVRGFVERFAHSLTTTLTALSQD
ncbi:GlcNAc-PI de-N-acetylase [Piscirickettsia salmonis]|uniref:Bacillithiol biosynthesis deacetylase BshB1 n=1 Tax=Piscirickettsia salmonis TaxID=1238 RepID=A0A9Q5VD27_PISSA|nr:PIG-L family deacetylase [Piscirickettsia salmonis]ALA25762.1 glcNAc-PI de-N-acetylase family protein [Piscirickettsia salmonis]APS43247.1 GlcNAc-PI de-N-acetylase [Piscirickettsia salmonis]APS46595.1 GlcNAc-PI de-N-acetylase [Piscirickettsia salmonis]APS50572.1 GlcNAc-PI de-N-acetylase [Piscirickettsia salmonis]APS53775.1 GlcNAc-PI de-N-acetylase [Piscirickettsia salmonis]